MINTVIQKIEDIKTCRRTNKNVVRSVQVEKMMKGKNLTEFKILGGRYDEHGPFEGYLI